MEIPFYVSERSCFFTAILLMSVLKARGMPEESSAGESLCLGRIMSTFRRVMVMFIFWRREGAARLRLFQNGVAMGTFQNETGGILRRIGLETGGKWILLRQGCFKMKTRPELLCQAGMRHRRGLLSVKAEALGVRSEE